MKQFKLRTLIIAVVLATFFMTMLINLWSAYRIDTEVLTENTLETNRVYAKKLATTADSYIEETFATLRFSAKYVADHLDDEELLATEAERIRAQSGMFNSVIIANKDGFVLGVSPPSLELKGQTLRTPGPLEAISRKKPTISKPYQGSTGRLIIFISYPIFNEAGDYMGLLGGSIYIKENNIFHSLLGQHFYDDGSYVYVVDRDGRVIYHKDPNRLNDVVQGNEVVEKVINGESGALEAVNSRGIRMLAGYSEIKHADWGVVVQRPKEAAIAPATDLVKKLVYIALPLLVVGLLGALWFAVKIARPLNLMTKITARSTELKTVEELHQVPAWYYETNTLKDILVRTLGALHNQVSHFKSQSTTDPLTKLTNRRTMDEVLNRWTTEEVPYAVIMVDLDFFKSVNDTYGHSVGDEVLKYLAQKMTHHAPKETVCCRYGGEEFMMIMPNATEETAWTVAENLRKDLEMTISPCGRPVTMSGGIALFPYMGDTSAQIIEKADIALYKAKQNGRNQVQVASTNKE